MDRKWLIAISMLLGLFLTMATLGWVAHGATATSTTMLKTTHSPMMPMADFTGTSELNATYCMSQGVGKVCFDGVRGGTVGFIYNLERDPEFNYVLPYMGGAFQIALRSTDEIISCTGHAPIYWGQVWNPTQAGCENCYYENGAWYHVESTTWGESYGTGEDGNPYYQITFRPRNYYHHNQDDCSNPLPYTEGVIQAEDITATQLAKVYDDGTMNYQWVIEHWGDHTHYTDGTSRVRNEVPVFYFSDPGYCPTLEYLGVDGDLHIVEMPCGEMGAWGEVLSLNRGYVMHTAAGMVRVMQSDIRSTEPITILYRCYFGGNGIAVDFSGYDAIEPSSVFTITECVAWE